MKAGWDERSDAPRHSEPRPSGVRVSFQDAEVTSNEGSVSAPPLVSHARNHPCGTVVDEAQVRSHQEWFNMRLLGLRSYDFHESRVAIFTMQRLQCPSEFEGPFYNFGPRHHSLELPEDEKQELVVVAAVLIFCDIDSDSEMQDANTLVQSIDRLGGTVAPPVVLVPHSGCSTAQLRRDSDAQYEALAGARDVGFDACIIGEPRGFSLALAVRSELQMQTQRCECVNRRLEERMEKVQHAERLKNSIEAIVWTYLRHRIPTTSVPPVDPDIGQCVTGEVVCGFRVGEVLGSGTFGIVFALRNLHDSDSAGTVFKALAKEQMTDLTGLTKLNAQLEVQKLLAQSWSHPNLVHLHAVYHSTSHVLIQMQDGGSCDLFKRLRERGREKKCRHRPLSAGKVASIVIQCMKAVCHLHSGPHVVHRDIKPENFIVSETQDDIRIRLADFDLASVMPENAMSKSMVGSFPFMAPEMLLRTRYGPFAADIWSVGVVSLEVLCGLRILNLALSLPPARDVEARRISAQVIFDFFEDTDSVQEFLDECMIFELRSLFDSSRSLLSGILNVHAHERWDAARITKELTTYSKSAGYPVSTSEMP